MRAASIVVALEAAGLVFFLSLLDSRAAETLRAGAIRLALAAVVLIVLQHVIAPARLAASFSGILDGSLQAFYASTNAGLTHGLRLAGFVAVVAGLSFRRYWLALIGAIVACASFAGMGHTTTHSPRWLLAILLTIHVIVVAFWFGSLRPLHRISSHRSDGAIGLLDSFSRIASRAVPLILVAGIGLAFVFLDSFAALFSPYGLMIVAKLSGFALLLGLASYNRWRLLPRIRAGDVTAVETFGKSAMTEWWVIVLLVVMTVFVTALFSP